MIALFIAAVLSADIPKLESRLSNYKALMDESAKKKIAEYEIEKEQAKKRLAMYLRNRENSAANKARYRQDYEKLIKNIDADIEYRKNRQNFILLDTKNGEPGDIGWIMDVIEIRQILSPTEALIEHDGRTLWVEGFDTAGKTDEQQLKSNVLYEIVGTKQYTNTVGVKRTIRHLRVIPWEEWEKVGGKRWLGKYPKIR